MNLNEFYAHHAARMVGAPATPDEAGEFARYMGRAKTDEEWGAFTERITHERGIAARAADIRLPAWCEEEDEGGWGFWAPVDSRVHLEAAFDISLDNGVSLDVYVKACELVSHWMHIPLQHDPNSAEFIWARMRMVLAPLGPKIPAVILDALTTRYPLCPFTEDDGEEEQKKAHHMCGWPATLTLADWTQMEFGAKGQAWHRTLAFFHLLRHVRVDDKKNITISFRGTTTLLTPDQTTNMFGQWGKQRAHLFAGLKVKGAKEEPIGHAAFAGAMRRMSSAALVRRRALTDLPAQVLCGPWSRCTSDPSGVHGLRLEGVWVAQGGKVKRHFGDESDVLDWNWNFQDAHEENAEVARQQFIDVLPSTYDVAFPSDIFFRTFTQMERLDGEYGLILKCLFDAPIIASLIRSSIPDLKHEFPIIAFLPSTPTLDRTTNQGKTAAAHTYARALVPSVVSLGASDSGSAPDVRAVADVVRTYGTAYLDEFRMPRSKNHPLSRENLQSLCTGGSITAGRVLENSGTLRLRHPLVLSAKGLDTTPDILNRTIPWFLGDLTEETRADPKNLNDILTGRVAMNMRLGGLAMVEKFGLADLGQVGGSSLFRFPVHRALAMKLAIWRGCDPRLVDEVFVAMQHELSDHCKKADESGVLNMLEEGKVVRLRWGAFWEDLSESAIESIFEYLAAHGRREISTGGWVHGSVPQLIEARMRAADMPDAPFCELLTRISGQQVRCGNKSVTTALSEELRRELEMQTPTGLPGLSGLQYEFSWSLERSTVQVAMRKRARGEAA